MAVSMSLVRNLTSPVLVVAQCSIALNFGSQQDYVVGKSGSPHIYVGIIWPRFKQNNMTNTTFEKYSQIVW